MLEALNFDAEFPKDFISQDSSYREEFKAYHPDKHGGDEKYKLIAQMLGATKENDITMFRKLMREYRQKYGGPNFKTETPQERAH